MTQENRVTVNYLNMYYIFIVAILTVWGLMLASVGGRISDNQEKIIKELRIQNENTYKVIKSLEFVSKIADRF